MKIRDTIKGADISPCGKYRWRLWRETPDLNPRDAVTALFVLNNPSTADAKVDDPTATRGWGYTEAWQCNRMVFLNTNPTRATDPKNAHPAEHAAQMTNDVYLHWSKASLGPRGGIIVLAWGDDAHPELSARALATLQAPLFHLGTRTVKGNPRHILYLSAALKPQEWAQ